MEASDLVKDSELETKFFDDHLRHIFYRRGTNATDRRIRLSEKWVRNRQLGSGSFGTVWLETCKKTVRQGTPTTRAVKEIKVHPRVDITRELEAIAKFSNNKFEPCFVRSYGWFRGPESIFITMEYILHGDLRHHLRKLLPESEVKTISQQLLEGLKHMFDNRFVHRDLKPENILVVAKGPHWLVQISDFGISKRLQEGGTIQGTMRQGTLGFMAPELLGFVAEKRFPFAVDMWSLGAVAFRMFTGKQYLADYDEMREFVQGNRPFPSEELLGGGISEAGLDFIQKLLLADPGSRMTPDTAGAHEWVKSSMDADHDMLSTPDISDNSRRSSPVQKQTEAQQSSTPNLTAARDTVMSKPSARWTWQTTNPDERPRFDDMDLHDGEDELESATLQLAQADVQDAPSVPDAPKMDPLPEPAGTGQGRESKSQERDQKTQGQQEKTQGRDKESQGEDKTAQGPGKQKDVGAGQQSSQPHKGVKPRPPDIQTKIHPGLHHPYYDDSEGDASDEHENEDETKTDPPAEAGKPNNGNMKAADDGDKWDSSGNTLYTTSEVERKSTPEAPQPPGNHPSVIVTCSLCGDGAVRPANASPRADFIDSLVPCHETCNLLVCKTCLELEIEGFMINTMPNLPRCANGLPLEYNQPEPRLLSKAPDKNDPFHPVGAAYTIIKHLLSTDEDRCCTQPRCRELVKRIPTPVHDPKTGRSWRACRLCKTKYCTYCLRELSDTAVHSGVGPDWRCNVDTILRIVETLRAPARKMDHQMRFAVQYIKAARAMGGKSNMTGAPGAQTRSGDTDSSAKRLADEAAVDDDYFSEIDEDMDKGTPASYRSAAPTPSSPRAPPVLSHGRSGSGSFPRSPGQTRPPPPTPPRAERRYRVSMSESRESLKDERTRYKVFEPEEAKVDRVYKGPESRESPKAGRRPKGGVDQAVGGDSFLDNNRDGPGAEYRQAYDARPTASFRRSRTRSQSPPAYERNEGRPSYVEEYSSGYPY